MRINCQEITVRELASGSADKKRNLVSDGILKDYPLNVFYWAENSDTDFEVLDGRQRSIKEIRSGFTQSEF